MPDAGLVSGRVVSVPLVVAIGSKFGKYRPEEEKEVRKVDVKKDEVLRQLKDAWRRYGPRSWGVYIHEDALEAVRKISYTAADVEKFTIALAEFQNERDLSVKAGVFLSALINNGKEIDFVIHTGHLTEGINYLGYENTKNILVNGNIGDYVGEQMKGGTIVVNGTAGKYVGDGMKGGAILVNGNTDTAVGCVIRGGTITVNGNASDFVGDCMKGGEIHLNGGYGSIAETIKKGKIYHKGVLIVGK